MEKLFKIWHGDISWRSFTFRRVFHRPSKPPFPWFARVTARAIAHASCQGLVFLKDFKSLFIVLFLEIVSWKGASRFNFMGGGISFDGGRVSSKKIIGWRGGEGGVCPPLWETLLSIIKNSAIFRHIHILLRNIQPYCGIFRTLHNCCIFRSLAYSEPKIYSELCQGISWHIQNTM